MEIFSLILNSFLYIVNFICLIGGAIVAFIIILCDLFLNIVVNAVINVIIPILSLIVYDLVIPFVSSALIFIIWTFWIIIALVIILSVLLLYAGYRTKPEISSFELYLQNLSKIFETISNNEAKQSKLNEQKNAAKKKMEELRKLEDKNPEKMEIGEKVPSVSIIEEKSYYRKFIDSISNYGSKLMENGLKKYLLYKITSEATKSSIHYNFGCFRICGICFDNGGSMINIIFIGILDTWFPIYSY